ncbi:MAG: heme ABC exporter ATP-binding protein CcmA [Acidobacteriota bacterium]
MSGDPLLSVSGLSKRLSGRAVLREVNLNLLPGQLTLLLGPNGAGKTTLTRILTTLSRPGRGVLTFRGSRTTESTRVRLRAELGYISHQTFLYAHLTAEENLLFFARLYGVPDPASRAAALLEEVGLAGVKDRVVGTFSRGMQQRLSLARVLLPDPSLLILDEPYAGLDPEGSRRLTGLMASLKARHRALLLVTHEMEDCLPIADRVVILHRGAVAWEGPAEGLTVEGLKARYFETTGEGGPS